MTKAELVASIAEDTGETQEKVECVLNGFIDVAGTTLADGDVVEVGPLGRFIPRPEGEHEGTDPNTHEPITIPASTRILFHPASALRDLVNSESPVEDE